MLKQINWPQDVKSCGHAEGLCQALTAIVPGSTGHGAYRGGPSADVVIGKAVNPSGHRSDHPLFGGEGRLHR